MLIGLLFAGLFYHVPVFADTTFYHCDVAPGCQVVSQHSNMINTQTNYMSEAFGTSVGDLSPICGEITGTYNTNHASWIGEFRYTQGNDVWCKGVPHDMNDTIRNIVLKAQTTTCADGFTYSGQGVCEEIQLCETIATPASMPFLSMGTPDSPGDLCRDLGDTYCSLSCTNIDFSEDSPSGTATCTQSGSECTFGPSEWGPYADGYDGGNSCPIGGCLEPPCNGFSGCSAYAEEYCDTHCGIECYPQNFRVLENGWPDFGCGLPLGGGETETPTNTGEGEHCNSADTCYNEANNFCKAQNQESFVQLYIYNNSDNTFDFTCGIRAEEQECPEGQTWYSAEAQCLEDTDADNVPDAFDEDPADGNVSGDSDGDGVPDHLDAFPNNGNEHSDYDGDGIGDNSDPNPYFNDNNISVVVTLGTDTQHSDVAAVGESANFNDSAIVAALNQNNQLQSQTNNNINNVNNTLLNTNNILSQQNSKLNTNNQLLEQIAGNTASPFQLEPVDGTEATNAAAAAFNKSASELGGIDFTADTIGYMDGIGDFAVEDCQPVDMSVRDIELVFDICQYSEFIKLILELALWSLLLWFLWDSLYENFGPKSAV